MSAWQAPASPANRPYRPPQPAQPQDSLDNDFPCFLRWGGAGPTLSEILVAWQLAVWGWGPAQIVNQPSQLDHQPDQTSWSGWVGGLQPAWEDQFRTGGDGTGEACRNRRYRCCMNGLNVWLYTSRKTHNFIVFKVSEMWNPYLWATQSFFLFELLFINVPSPRWFNKYWDLKLHDHPSKRFDSKCELRFSNLTNKNPDLRSPFRSS